MAWKTRRATNIMNTDIKCRNNPLLTVVVVCGGSGVVANYHHHHTQCQWRGHCSSPTHVVTQRVWWVLPTILAHSDSNFLYKWHSFCAAIVCMATCITCISTSCLHKPKVSDANKLSKVSGQLWAPGRTYK